jgi:hypothetical protein
VLSFKSMKFMTTLHWRIVLSGLLGTIWVATALYTDEEVKLIMETLRRNPTLSNKDIIASTKIPSPTEKTSVVNLPAVEAPEASPAGPLHEKDAFIQTAAGAVEPAASLPAPASFAQIAEAYDSGCTDTPTSWMVNNGKTCAEDVNYSNNCKHDPGWVTNMYCQQSCFDNGAGYDGFHCSTPAPTSAPTSAPTGTEAPTSAPTPYWGDPDNNCRDPSIPAPPICIDKYAGFRCSNGTSHADAGDKQACAEAAAAANHAFMSFNSMTSACESTTACSVRTEADGWNAHKAPPPLLEDVFVVSLVSDTCLVM